MEGGFFILCPVFGREMMRAKIKPINGRVVMP